MRIYEMSESLLTYLLIMLKAAQVVVIPLRRTLLHGEIKLKLRFYFNVNNINRKMSYHETYASYFSD